MNNELKKAIDLASEAVEQLQKSEVGGSIHTETLMKSHVKGYTRTTASGAAIQVKEHDDKRSVAIPHSPKTVELPNGHKLHFWYANNKGRGDDNCTIIRSTKPRAAVSAAQEEIIAQTRTSSWRGHVNFSKDVRKKMGLEDE
jgi:hypothetical protein